MFTVVPLHARRIDRPAAAVALAVVPVVGVVLGRPAGAVAAGLVAAGAPGLLAGLVAVGLGAAATRGLHLDGLADLADGLGSHGDAERTLAVMRDPGTGAFAVIWLVVVLGSRPRRSARWRSGAWWPRRRRRAGPGAGARRVRLGGATGRAGGVPGRARRPGRRDPAGVAGAGVGGGARRRRVPGARWLRAVIATLLAAVVVVLVAAHARRRLGGRVGRRVRRVRRSSPPTVALAVPARRPARGRYWLRIPR